jgi:hypothetical protein
MELENTLKCFWTLLSVPWGSKSPGVRSGLDTDPVPTMYPMGGPSSPVVLQVGAIQCTCWIPWPHLVPELNEHK